MKRIKKINEKKLTFAFLNQFHIYRGGTDSQCRWVAWAAGSIYNNVQAGSAADVISTSYFGPSLQTRSIALPLHLNYFELHTESGKWMNAHAIIQIVCYWLESVSMHFTPLIAHLSHLLMLLGFLFLGEVSTEWPKIDLCAENHWALVVSECFPGIWLLPGHEIRVKFLYMVFIEIK